MQPGNRYISTASISRPDRNQRFTTETAEARLAIPRVNRIYSRSLSLLFGEIESMVRSWETTHRPLSPGKLGLGRSNVIGSSSVPKYLRQIRMAGRRPPNADGRAPRQGEARCQTPAGDPLHQSLPETNHRLSQMHDQSSRTLGYPTARLQHVIAKPSQVPATTQSVLQFDPQQIGKIERQQAQQQQAQAEQAQAAANAAQSRDVRTSWPPPRPSASAKAGRL